MAVALLALRFALFFSALVCTEANELRQSVCRSLEDRNGARGEHYIKRLLLPRRPFGPRLHRSVSHSTTKPNRSPLQTPIVTMRLSILAFLSLSSSLVTATICPLKVPACCQRYGTAIFNCKDRKLPTSQSKCIRTFLIQPQL